MIEYYNNGLYMDMLIYIATCITLYPGHTMQGLWVGGGACSHSHFNLCPTLKLLHTGNVYAVESGLLAFRIT